MQNFPINPIPIHEFSTGVVLDKSTSGDNIVSLSQKWMNISFPDEKIPHSIQRAIINQFFVATGTEEEPTIIGRVIPGIDGNWSVISINNLVKTTDGESIPVSRFFVTLGNTLENLVNWVQSQYLLLDSYPIWNPLRPLEKTRNQLFLFSQDQLFLSQQFKQEYNQKAKENTPIILNEELPLTTVYQRAEYLAKLNISPLAFAYQAVNLKRCRSFHLIHTLNEGNIREVISREHLGINPNIIVFDEDKIKVLIKRLIHQEAFSLTALNAFMREVIESGLPQQYWHKIFDDFGASIALTKEIAPPSIIKLLTLRCLAIPETEQELIAWIGKNRSFFNTEVYNSFRGKLLRNISSLYGNRFDLFSLDDQG
ncbi:hypothetical protein [Crocosphaera sp.]|uniref:hypothetical protein n=1 Tax=Crocosphaera sp. TaxID=2729996 RepID=UPI003F27C122